MFLGQIYNWIRYHFMKFFKTKAEYRIVNRSRSKENKRKYIQDELTQTILQNERKYKSSFFKARGGISKEPTALRQRNSVT